MKRDFFPFATGVVLTGLSYAAEPSYKGLLVGWGIAAVAGFLIGTWRSRC